MCDEKKIIINEEEQKISKGNKRKKELKSNMTLNDIKAISNSFCMSGMFSMDTIEIINTQKPVVEETINPKKKIKKQNSKSAVASTLFTRKQVALDDNFTEASVSGHPYSQDIIVPLDHNINDDPLNIFDENNNINEDMPIDGEVQLFDKIKKERKKNKLKFIYDTQQSINNKSTQSTNQSINQNSNLTVSLFI